MKNNLPESWCVSDNGSQLFKDTVVEYLNTNHNSLVRVYDNCPGLFFGIDCRGKVRVDITKSLFGKEISIEEFIELSKPIKEERVFDGKFQYGDILVSNDNPRTARVIGVIDDVVFLSDEFNQADSSIYTHEELLKGGWRLKPKEPKIKPIKLTLQEIAEKFGVPVDRLKIVD